MQCVWICRSLQEHTVFQREDLLCGWLFLTAWCLITSLPARVFFFFNHQQNVKQKKKNNFIYNFSPRQTKTAFSVFVSGLS